MGLNWIRSGSYSDEDDDKLDDYFSDEDPNGIYETVVEQTLTVFGGLEITGGTWAPYRFSISLSIVVQDKIIIHHSLILRCQNTQFCRHCIYIRSI